jgi:uncharacterized membrane protein
MHALTLVLHIAGGTLALLAGAAAFVFRKGGRLHAKAGTIFVVAILILTANAEFLAWLKPDRVSMTTAFLTFYLVATAWATARRRDGKTGRFELAALPVALACAMIDIAFGAQALSLPGGKLDSYPAGLYFAFGGFAALAALLDLNFILRRTLSGRQRIRRHLWRMCVASFIASGSFFLGQQKIMPEAMKGAWYLFVLALAPLGLMVFWLLRVRFAEAFRYLAPRGQPLVTAPQSGTS